MNTSFPSNTPAQNHSVTEKIKNILVIWMSIGLFVQLTCNFWLSAGSSQATQINLWLMLPTLIFLCIEIKKIKSFSYNKKEALVLFFILWYVLSATWSNTDKADIVIRYTRNAAYVLTYLFAIRIIYQYKRQFLIKSIDLAAVAIAIGAIVTLYTQVYLPEVPLSFRGTRISDMGIAGLGRFSTSIQSGMFFGAFAVLAFSRFLCIKDKTMAFLFLLNTVIFSTYVFYTGTRGAMAGVILGFTACVASIHPRLLKHLVLFSIPVIALLVYFTTNISRIPLTVETMEQLLASITSHRWFAWEQAITALFEQPLIGFGADAKMDIYNPIINFTYHHPHNGFVLIAYETGLIGLMLYILSMSTVLIYCFKNANKAELKMALALIVFSLTAMMADVHVVVTRPHIYYVFLWLPVGIVLAAAHSSHVNDKNNSLTEKK